MKPDKLPVPIQPNEFRHGSPIPEPVTEKAAPRRADVDVELVDKFHDFLMGGKPPGEITLAKRPRKMTAEQSMAVIYVIQEFLHAIPDCYEMCLYCGRIFDTETEGHIGSEGQDYCDNCSYLCKCSGCERRGKL